jgi:hypothetical protein
MIVNGLSQDLIELLDKELNLYVCLTSKIKLKDAYGNTVSDANGKPVKVSAKKICLPSLRESIITKCCYEVNKPSIESFFMNAGLRAAWDKVSTSLRVLASDDHYLREAFDYI